MNENTVKFLTVGAFSKLTGVRIKSLRYYDAIGALKPAYVNPETNYRYYTHEQVHVLEAIRLCIELDIPLSDFSNFVDERGRLRYGRLIEHGRELALRKIRAIKEDLDYLEDIRRIIGRGEAYSHGHDSLIFSEHGKFLWTSPYDGAQSYGVNYSRITQIINAIVDAGLKFRYECGTIRICGEKEEQYYYCELDISEKEAMNYPNILRVPPLSYKGIMLKKSGINRAEEFFPDMLTANKSQKYVFEIEISTGEYDYLTPVYELRCSCD